MSVGSVCLLWNEAHHARRDQPGIRRSEPSDSDYRYMQHEIRAILDNRVRSLAIETHQVGAAKEQVKALMPL